MTAGIRPRRSHSRYTAGFTVLELAVTISIIGVLSVLASSAYSGVLDVRARAHAQAEAEAARAAVRTFLLRNKRLPCPDLSSNGAGGREGLAGSCPNGAQLGWLPYESLGLPPPQPSQRMRYAVSRLGAGADLVAPPDLGVADFDGVARLRNALSQAAKLGLGSDRPYLTGVGSAADPENCSHVVANPAFALIAPVADRDDVGSTHPGFDGINRAMADASAHCIAAPGRAMDATYDDVVLAESASALLGWLVTTTR